MRYVSTRGGVEPVSFSEAVMMGLATDGGLLLPETIPTIDDQTIAEWGKLSYQQLAEEVLACFIEDIPRDDLGKLVAASYKTFSHPEITPLVKKGAVQILELFHGPTLAFKDVALQFLGYVFEYLLQAYHYLPPFLVFFFFFFFFVLLYILLLCFYFKSIF